MVSEFPSLHGVPGSAPPPATPRQSKGAPTHWQLVFHVSLPVLALPSLHGEPGTAAPPVTPRQSTNWPVQAQLAPTTSLIVFGLPSLQADPGSGFPQPHAPGAVLFGSVGHPSATLHTPSPSESGKGVNTQDPPAHPSEVQGLLSLHGSGTPTHWHEAFHVSFTVQALPSLQAVPGAAGPLGTPRQSVATGVITT